VPQDNSSVTINVTAFYHFKELSPEKLIDLESLLKEFSQGSGLRGLIVIGNEGVNGTVAASEEVIGQFKILLCQQLQCVETEFKDSTAQRMPFGRFKVALRPEIITTKDSTLSHLDSVGTHLSAKEWHELLNSDEEYVLVDTRNTYETEVGTFKDAIDPKIAKFSDFDEFVRSADLPKDKKLLLFCTGGIRCEKAVPEVKRLGYEKVYQLEGGILKYLKEYPNQHFEGECFVFDHRVSVDQNLQPSTTYKLCKHCGNPGKEAITCIQCDTKSTVCSKCLQHPHRETCSKNCAYHANKRLSKVTLTKSQGPNS